MMATDTLKMEIDVGINVSDNTAEACRILLEIYSTRNGKAVRRYQKEEGSVGYEWEDVTWQPA